MDLTGNPKVLILAFGHYDNVLSYAKHVGNKVDLSVIFVIDTNRLRTGTMDVDLAGVNDGIISENESRRLLPSTHQQFIDDKFHFRFLKLPRKQSLKKGFIRNFIFLRNYSNIIKNEKYDLIHFNGTGLTAFVMANLLKGMPKIWTLHDFKPHTGEGRKLSVFLQRRMAGKFTCYIQHYKYLKKAFSEYYNVSPRNVFQIYSGTFDLFKHLNREKEPIIDNSYILWFGRISPYKGLLELVEAYNELSLQKDNLPKLVIAGEGNLWFDQNLITKNKNIIFLHKRIPTQELINLISNCDYVAAPYKDATHSAVVMVSYAFNKPVLSTNVGGLSEVVIDNETGKLVLNNTKKDILKGLQSMNDKEKIRQMGLNIQRLCDEGYISWNNIADDYLNAYTETIKKSDK